MKQKVLLICLDNPIDRRIINIYETLKGNYKTYIFTKTISTTKKKNQNINYKRLGRLEYLLYSFFIKFKKILKSFSQTSKNNLVINLIISLMVFFFFLKKILKYKPDLIISCDQKTLLAGYLYSKIFRINYIFDCHEIYLDNKKGFFLKKLHNLQSYLMKNSFMNFVVSKSMEKIYLKQYKLKNIIIFKNLLLKKIQKNNKKKNYLKKEKALLQFVYVGAFIKNRNLEKLIHNFSQLDKLFKWKLSMYGYGRLKPKLNLLIKKYKLENNIYLKFIENNFLISEISNFDCGLIPYSTNSINNRISLPNKFFEYVAAGIPIMTNRLPEVTKYKNKIQSLRFMDINNINNFRKNISYLNNKKKLTQLKYYAQKNKNNYDWSIYNEKILSIVSEAIEQKKNKLNKLKK